MYEGETEDIIKAQNKSEEALARVIEANSGLIWSAVQRFSGRGHAMEDLYQIGCIGLIKAIQRFDTSYNVRISTYAVPYIIGEIKRFIRDDGPIKISRSIKELATKINELQRQHINKTGEEMKITELAESLNVTKEEIVVALDANRKPESIDEEVYDEAGGETKISKISTNKDETGNIINKDFAYYEIPFKIDVFDEETFEKSNTDFWATVTNIETGEAEYLKLNNHYLENYKL